MKKSLLILSLFFAVGGLVFFGVGKAKPIAPGVKVGVMVSASGPLYFAAAYQKAGCELAGVASDHRVSCVYADAGDSDSQARTAMNTMANSNVDLILAPIDTEAAKKVVLMNSAKAVPVVATAPIGEIPTKANHPLFRMATTDSQDTSALAAYIASTDPESVLLIVASDGYSKQIAKQINFNLTLRGITPVTQLGIQESRVYRKLHPEVLVLVSMEQSLDFFEANSAWFSQLDKKFLVAGNLANYSIYSWAKQLQGTKGLLPAIDPPREFKQKLADLMDRPGIMGTNSSPMFTLAWRTYQAAMLASSAGKDLAKQFSSTGYLASQTYTVYAYKTNGMFTSVGSFSPDTP